VRPLRLAGQLQRKQVKAMLREWERRHPGPPGHDLHLAANVAPSHLLDRQLHDFKNLAAEPDSPITFPIRVTK
jgi:tRNA 2-thiocytidine biosynthesis protein TtcA